MAPTWASNNACASTGNTLRTSVRSRSSRGEKRFQNKPNLWNTDHIPLLDEHITVEPQLTAKLYRFEAAASVPSTQCGCRTDQRYTRGSNPSTVLLPPLRHPQLEV